MRHGPSGLGTAIREGNNPSASPLLSLKALDPKPQGAGWLCVKKKRAGINTGPQLAILAYLQQAPPQQQVAGPVQESPQQQVLHTADLAGV
ncbi:MAG: hypothetical protein JNK63_08960 [Chthonomonas sp.]|nr:hypothetical protein [Chthonomonas sp.]